MKKGSKMTVEQRKRVSEGHNGQIPWNIGKKTGKGSWNKGISMSEESKRKMILSKEITPPKKYTCSMCSKKFFSKVWNSCYCGGSCYKEGTKEHRKKLEVRSAINSYKRKFRQNPEVKKKDIKDHIRYNNRRRKKDVYFRNKLNLRRRVVRAFRDFTKTGKIMTSREYGIDYGKIIEHLMKNRPEGVANEDLGNYREWHIDHIMPLSKFDLNNPDEVKKAFAPENHQWLTAEENMRKGNKILQK